MTELVESIGAVLLGQPTPVATAPWRIDVADDAATQILLGLRRQHRRHLRGHGATSPFATGSASGVVPKRWRAIE